MRILPNKQTAKLNILSIIHVIHYVSINIQYNLFLFHQHKHALCWIILVLCISASKKKSVLGEEINLFYRWLWRFEGDHEKHRAESEYHCWRSSCRGSNWWTLYLTDGRSYLTIADWKANSITGLQLSNFDSYKNYELHVNILSKIKSTGFNVFFVSLLIAWRYFSSCYDNHCVFVFIDGRKTW